MKRIFLVFLLLLCGCSMKSGEEIMTETTEIAEEQSMAVPVHEETTIPTESELLSLLIHPKDTDIVRVRDYIPEVLVELNYATENNFTGQVIYDFQDVYLRYGTVMKLKAVSDELSQQGLSMKIWDGFRPVSAQFKLWEIYPDDTYVANPNKGYSNHSRGFAVDVTLVDHQGRDLVMPTGFDDFSSRADRDYSDCSEEEANNARLLEAVMEKHGFSGYWGEWWHFNDTRKYDVETCFDPAVVRQYILKNDAILLEHFFDASSEILKIPSGDSVTLLGYDEGYALVEYWGYRGYLPLECISKE